MNTPETASTVAELAADKRPVFLMPGFTWDSELSLGPLKNDLESLGHDVVSADYYDSRLKSGEAYGIVPKTATERLALEALRAIDQSGLKDTPLTVVAHSYGALIYQQAFDFAKKLGWQSLVPGNEMDSREVVFLAPSGSVDNERLARIMGRYTLNLGSLAINSHLDRAFLRQQKRLFAEPVTRMREAWRLAHERMDYGSLAVQGIHAHVVAYNGDKVFKADELDRAQLNGQDAASIGTLTSYAYINDRRATHSEPYLNGERNAKVIHQILTKAA